MSNIKLYEKFNIATTPLFKISAVSNTLPVIFEEDTDEADSSSVSSDGTEELDNFGCGLVADNSSDRSDLETTSQVSSLSSDSEPDNFGFSVSISMFSFFTPRASSDMQAFAASIKKFCQ